MKSEQENTLVRYDQTISNALISLTSIISKSNDKLSTWFTSTKKSTSNGFKDSNKLFLDTIKNITVQSYFYQKKI